MLDSKSENKSASWGLPKSGASWSFRSALERGKATFLSTWTLFLSQERFSCMKPLG